MNRFAVHFTSADRYRVRTRLLGRVWVSRSRLAIRLAPHLPRHVRQRVARSLGCLELPTSPLLTSSGDIAVLSGRKYRRRPPPTVPSTWAVQSIDVSNASNEAGCVALC